MTKNDFEQLLGWLAQRLEHRTKKDIEAFEKAREELRCATQAVVEARQVLHNTIAHAAKDYHEARSNLLGVPDRLATVADGVTYLVTRKKRRNIRSGIKKRKQKA